MVGEDFWKYIMPLTIYAVLRKKSTALQKIIFLGFHSYVWNLGGNAQIPNELLVQNRYFIIWVKREGVPTANLNAIAANLVQLHWRQSEISPNLYQRNLKNGWDEWPPDLFPWFIFLLFSGNHHFSLPSKNSCLYRVMRCLCSFSKRSA